MAILSYTTTVSTEATADEVRKLLRKWGATEITEHHQPKSDVVDGISFVIDDIEYRLFCDFQSVFLALQNDFDVGYKYQNLAQARRVAWRNMLGWLKFTMSIVEIGLFSKEQALMPYHVVTNGETLWEVYHNRNLRLESKE